MIVHRCWSHPSKAVGIHQDGLRLVLLDQNLPYQSHNEFHFLGNRRGFDPNIPHHCWRVRHHHPTHSVPELGGVVRLYIEKGLACHSMGRQDHWMSLFSQVWALGCQRVQVPLGNSRTPTLCFPLHLSPLPSEQTHSYGKWSMLSRVFDHLLTTHRFSFLRVICSHLLQ